MYARVDDSNNRRLKIRTLDITEGSGDSSFYAKVCVQELLDENFCCFWAIYIVDLAVCALREYFNDYRFMVVNVILKYDDWF